jgi:two-component system response regulator RegX3
MHKSRKLKGFSAQGSGERGLKSRILIVEDEREIGELIGLYLRKEGFETSLAQSAEEALAQFERTSFDLVTLDINLPGMDGFEFLQELRRRSDVPVLIVSARDEDEDLVLGLGIGADEFVTKPFSPRVLAARARAILRRNRKNRQAGESRDTVRFGKFTLDIPGHLLELEGARVPLPPMEFELLKLLVTNAGVAMSPKRIYQAVWAQEFGDIATVSVHIRRLRRRIEGDLLRPQYIQTIRGAGYRFNPAALENPP